MHQRILARVLAEVVTTVSPMKRGLKALSREHILHLLQCYNRKALNKSNVLNIMTVLQPLPR